MRVINLQAWAGGDFSHLPGDVIELPDDVATVRIEAGLVAPAEPQSPLFPKASGEVPQKQGKKAKS